MEMRAHFERKKMSLSLAMRLLLQILRMSAILQASMLPSCNNITFLVLQFLPFSVSSPESSKQIPEKVSALQFNQKGFILFFWFKVPTQKKSLIMNHILITVQKALDSNVLLDKLSERNPFQQSLKNCVIFQERTERGYKRMVAVTLIGKREKICTKKISMTFLSGRRKLLY